MAAAQPAVYGGRYATLRYFRNFSLSKLKTRIIRRQTATRLVWNLKPRAVTNDGITDSIAVE